MNDPNFWQNVENSSSVMKRVDILNKSVSEYTDMLDRLEEIEVMIELEEDEEDISRKIAVLSEVLDKKEVTRLMSGEYDKNSAIVHIHSGAGGKDASDWAKMLERLYLRWANSQGYSAEILDRQEDEGGIKYTIFSVDGPYAFGKLSCESGIHRLVRISPFDSNARRHTSFASLTVSPDIGEIDFKIDPKNLKIESFRASGAGGQHVNTTDSAVRIRHIPSGISVSCSRERSQLQNRQHAMKILSSKLLELEIKKRDEEIRALSGDESSISWGNQIRSYVFHPYRLVKDHRTKVESSNLQSVMDGNIDLFIEEYLKDRALNKSRRNLNE